MILLTLLDSLVEQYLIRCHFVISVFFNFEKNTLKNKKKMLVVILCTKISYKYNLKINLLFEKTKIY